MEDALACPFAVVVTWNWFVTNVTVNNQGVHTNPGVGIFIADVVQEILIGEGNKLRYLHANVDPAEPESEEKPMEGMEDVDKGNLENEGIMNAPKQNAILEQITSTKTF